MTSPSAHAHSHRSTPNATEQPPRLAFSLLRVSVLTRLGIVAVVCAALWLAIVWALT
jgi:hypothetical protein